MQPLRSVKCRANASQHTSYLGSAAYMKCRYHDILALFTKVLLHKSRRKTGSKCQSQVSSFEIGVFQCICSKFCFSFCQFAWQYATDVERSTIQAVWVK